jgi:metal-responsive CopG/Arc/MetJ family transcriptional regulator
MATKTKRGAQPSAQGAVRNTVSFPPQLYATLEDLAKQKKVSFGWVVREAAEKYVADQWPLLQERR